MIVPPVLHALGSIVLAATTPPACPIVAPPQIEVVAKAEKTVIRHDMSQEQLKGTKIDTTLPYQMEDLSHVEIGGIMRGNINIGYEVETDKIPGNTAETVNMKCVRYKTIKITLTMAPTIFVATDYAKDSCWYEQILQHEQSHIDVDKAVIEKYIKRIKDGLQLAFSEPGDSVQGPVKSRKVAALEKSMGAQVVKMTDVLAADMVRERQATQQSVDSIRGYSFIMNSCYEGDNVFRPR